MCQQGNATRVRQTAALPPGALLVPVRLARDVADPSAGAVAPQLPALCDSPLRTGLHPNQGATLHHYPE